MNAYEERQAARKERLAERAEALREKSRIEYKKSDMSEAATGIPFGQPILVGHHSEGKHRRTIERANNAMRRSIELDKKADELERRANSESNAISADDPDAVEKLKEKLAKLEALQDTMKQANKLIRKKDVAGLEELLGKANAAEIQKPDFCGRVGFASYQLSNNNANMRRIKDRIGQLEREAARPAAAPIDGQGFRVVEDPIDNRIRLEFDEKPPAEVRQVVKSHGFKWSPSRKAWVRMLNNAGRWNAERVAQILNERSA